MLFRNFDVYKAYTKTFTFIDKYKKKIFFLCLDTFFESGINKFCVVNKKTVNILFVDRKFPALQRMLNVMS